MPIMAKSNDEYTEVKAIKTPDGTEIDYVLSKVDNTYKRTYTAIRELEVTPPLEFKSIKPQANLLDYRIYGQTVDGESVGDRTANLFDGELYNGYYRANDGQLITDPSSNNFYKYVRSNLIPCTPQTTYTLKYVCTYTNKFVIFTWYSGDTFITSTSFTNVDAHTLTVTAPLSATKFGITISGIDNDPYTQTTIVPVDISNIMLNLGDTALPYEPYGYKVPVTVEGKNLVISYLVEVNGGIQFTPVIFAEVNLQPNTEYLITFTVHENGVKLYSNDLLFTSVNYPSETQGKKTMRLKTKTSIRSDQYINNKGWVLLRNARQNLSNFTITDVKLQLVSDAPIYLPEPIKMVGDEAEYIDYAEQKLHRVGAEDIDVTLPALPTVTGTNVLSVGTEVQPSDMYIKGNFKMIAGGGE